MTDWIACMHVHEEEEQEQEEDRKEKEEKGFIFLFFYCWLKMPSQPFRVTSWLLRGDWAVKNNKVVF